MARSHTNHLSPNSLNQGKTLSPHHTIQYLNHVLCRRALRLASPARDPHPAGPRHGQLRGSAAPQETEDVGELEQLARRPRLLAGGQRGGRRPRDGGGGEAVLPGPRHRDRPRRGVAGHRETVGSVLSLRRLNIRYQCPSY